MIAIFLHLPMDDYHLGYIKKSKKYIGYDSRDNENNKLLPWISLIYFHEFL